MTDEYLDKTYELAEKIEEEVTLGTQVGPYQLIIQNGKAWVKVEGTWRSLGGLIEECMDTIML